MACPGTGSGMPRPPLSDAARADRRADLLAAAARCYRVGHVLPTVAEIAAVAGVAKGTVYLSFPSKSAIFMALLDDALAHLFAGLAPLVAALPADRARLPAVFATGYARLVVDTDTLLPLATLAQDDHDPALTAAPMRALRERLAARFAAVGETAEQQLGLAPGQGVRLLLHTWVLTLGLWQTLDRPGAPEETMSPVTRAVFARDFGAELRSAVARLWRL